MEFIEENEELSNEINISDQSDWIKFNNKPVVVNDPFKIEGEELKKVNGLSSSFRRKVSRDIQKRFIGQEGTATQQNLMAQAVTGYAMFDLIEPPYNLEYLSRIYEFSAYNYAAINAKVANIVGLGFSFVETRKANEALDNITDDRQDRREHV